MNRLLTHGLAVFTLAAWGAIMVTLARGDQIRAYLTPAFRHFVEPSGWVLMTLALGYLFFVARNPNLDADPCRPSANRLQWRKLLGFVLLLVPIGLSFATPVGYTMAAVQNKGIVEDVSTLPGLSERFEKAKKENALPPAPVPTTPSTDGTLPIIGETTTKMTLEQLNDLDSETVAPPMSKDGNIQAEIVDLLFAAQEATLRPDFEGKSVEMIGQMMPETGPNPAGTKFRLLRMWMVCCAADARPVVLSVEGTEKPDFAEMTWIKVVGVAHFEMINGKLAPVVRATKVEASQPPEEMMLY